MNSGATLWIILLVIVVIWLVCRGGMSEGYSGLLTKSPAFGYYRYGYPYSYYGTWYRPQGYWGYWGFGNPYGYGGFGYGGKQQNFYCQQGCLKKYSTDCKEGSVEECAEKLDDCMDLCGAHAPYYDYTQGY